MVKVPLFAALVHEAKVTESPTAQSESGEDAKLYRTRLFPSKMIEFTLIADFAKVMDWVEIAGVTKLIDWVANAGAMFEMDWVA
ncbi:MAG: hypothetical protein EBR27_13955 [Betaproteobacteria bacterium]|nr:hypothetical protein [Betaproteobacteria bacterium]